MRESITTAIERGLRDERGRVLARDLWGTDDPRRIACDIDRFCREHAATTPSSVLHFELSVGAGLGLLMDDGRRAALKVHSGARQPEYLLAIARIQDALADAGLPCPRPLSTVAPLGLGHGMLEEYLGGEYADAHDPAIRGEMARGLALLLRTGRDIDATAVLPRGIIPRGGTFPELPSALFGTTGGTGALVGYHRVGAAARRVLDRSVDELIAGHCDWTVKNMRFAGGSIAAIYDWDSLYRGREVEFVGLAAAVFPMTWDIEVRRAPSLEEMDAFIGEYERHRGGAFDPERRRHVAAAATWWVAYNCCCEDAIDPDGSLVADSRRLLQEMHDVGRLAWLGIGRGDCDEPDERQPTSGLQPA